MTVPILSYPLRLKATQNLKKAVSSFNKGGFGCDAVACEFGQPNVPECVSSVFFNEVQRLRVSPSAASKSIRFYL
jgi:hypothetical protein